MFTEVWLDNAINKIVQIPNSLVYVLKMKIEISVAKCSKKRSYSSPLPSFGGKSLMFRFQNRTVQPSLLFSMSDCFTSKRDEQRLGHHEEAYAYAVAERRITEMVKT